MATFDHERAFEILAQVIRNRRSYARLAPEAPSREEIEQLLELARWAPNHFRTEPWRFFVLKGEAQAALGEVFARIAEPETTGMSERRREGRLLAERRKPLRAPVLIVVAVAPPDHDEVLMVENIAAAACAVQNLLLAAEAIGLAVKWRTSAFAYHELTKAHFGLTPDWHLLAFLYVGYPEPGAWRQEGVRTDVGEKTTWLGW